MPYEYWFSHTAQCRVPAPDVIFELGRIDDLPAVASRYTVTFEEPSSLLSSGSRRFPGAAVPTGQFLAVRNDLLQRSP
jgi:hypothetical protein